MPGTFAIATLVLAIEAQDRVVVYLRGDPATGRPVRAIEGVPVALVPLADGRERVVLSIAEGTEQFVLVERIIRVERAA